MSTETHVVELARRRHAGDRDRRCPDDPGRRRLPDAHRRVACRDRRRSRARVRAVRGRGDRGDRGHGRDRSTAGDRGHLCGGRAVVPRGRRRTAARRCSPTICVRRSQGSSEPTRSRSIRTNGSTRLSPAGVSWFGGWATWRSRSTRTPATSCRTRDTRNTGSTWAGTDRSSRRSFWALKVWVSLLAHGRQAYAATHLARRRAGALHGCARRGAAGVRAGGAGWLVDLLFPIRAPRPSGRRRW